MQKTAQGEVLYGNKDTDYDSFQVYQEFVTQKRTLHSVEEELKKMHPFNRTPRAIQEKLTEALGFEVDVTRFHDLHNIGGIFQQLDEQRGLVWATHNHSSSPLISIAYGAGAEFFGGVYHNTDIYPRMQKVLGWSK